MKQIWHMLFFVQFLTTRLRYVLNSRSIIQVNTQSHFRTLASGGGKCCPSKWCTLQKPRLTELVCSPAEFFVKITAIPGSPPRPAS